MYIMTDRNDGRCQVRINAISPAWQLNGRSHHRRNLMYGTLGCLGTTNNGPITWFRDIISDPNTSVRPQERIEVSNVIQFTAGIGKQGKTSSLNITISVDHKVECRQM